MLKIETYIISLRNIIKPRETKTKVWEVKYKAIQTCDVYLA